MKILTHTRPDLDAIATSWLLMNFGEEQFPGISNAEFLFDDSGEMQGLKGDGLLRIEIVAVDVGGGMFDHHPRMNEPVPEEKQGHCSLTLVAKYLGIDDDPALEEILKYVLRVDLKGGSQPFDLDSMVKDMNRAHPDKPEKVIELTMVLLSAKYLSQVEFWTKTKTEFETNSQIEEITSYSDRKFKIAFIESPNEQINRFAFSQSGGRISVLAQLKPTGHVQIYTGKMEGSAITRTFERIVALIRQREQIAKNLAPEMNPEVLRMEGKIQGAEEWWYQKTGQMLLNGSLKFPNVTPTKIPFEEIKDIIRKAVNR